MRIKSLELRAKVIVEGFWKGIHRSPHHGFSVEFTEYRSYHPGDDPRYLDWRVYARTDRLYIKKYEDETNLRCHLLIDQSRSMGYGSLGYTKADYAATLAATLATFLFSQGDAVGLATFDSEMRDYLPPRNRPGYLHRLLLSLSAAPEGTTTDLGPPLQKVAHLLTRRGLVVLISDLLTSIDRLETDLATLSTGGHDVVLFQVLDPAELHFRFATPARFRDAETGRHFYVDPAAVQKDYQHRLAEHLRRAESICQDLGIDYHLFATDRPLELGLLDFLHARQIRRKQVRRARNLRSRSTA
jgi:uncharacterized protein (DUF58 family)